MLVLFLLQPCVICLHQRQRTWSAARHLHEPVPIGFREVLRRSRINAHVWPLDYVSSSHGCILSSRSRTGCVDGSLEALEHYIPGITAACVFTNISFQTRYVRPVRKFDMESNNVCAYFHLYFHHWLENLQLILTLILLMLWSVYY